MQKNEPLISVVTVVYNGEAFLEETILSVINQTYKNIEFIIVDGGSTDDTIDIIRKYEEGITQWVSERDDGIYDAMNKGIDFARGNFIIFMNGGDSFYSNEVVSQLVNNLECDNCVYFARAQIKKEKVSWFYPPSTIEKKNMNTWLKHAQPAHQAIFFPKSFYAQNKYDLSYRINSDSDYKFRAEIEHEFVFVEMVICTFNLGGISTEYNNLKTIKNIIGEAWRVSMKYRGIRHAIYRVIMHVVKYFSRFLLKEKGFIQMQKIFKNSGYA